MEASREGCGGLGRSSAAPARQAGAALVSRISRRCEIVRLTEDRGRRRTGLGDCEITLHAVDRFLMRKRGACPLTARADLRALAAKAIYVRRLPTGEDLYRVEDLRLVVHRIARRAPLVLTVLPGEQLVS